MLIIDGIIEASLLAMLFKRILASTFIREIGLFDAGSSGSLTLSTLSSRKVGRDIFHTIV